MGRSHADFVDAGLPAPRFMDETAIVAARVRGPLVAGEHPGQPGVDGVQLGVDDPAIDGLAARIRDDALVRRLLVWTPSLAAPGEQP